MRKSSFEKERILWMSFSVILLFASLVSISKSKKEAANSSRRLKIMFKREADLRNEIELLNGTIEEARSASLKGYELQELKKRGLKHPGTDLFADLVRHENLMPDKGAMGGRRGYYYPDTARILNGRWFLGSFRNGNHLGGEALLQYKVSPSGKISWKLIDAYWEDVRSGRSGELSTH